MLLGYNLVCVVDENEGMCKCCIRIKKHERASPMERTIRGRWIEEEEIT